MHGFDRSCAVWPRTLWKIPSESARTSWIIRERQKWCTVGIISGKSSKNRSLGAPGQIYCPDNHLSFRRELLAGVPGPDPRSSTPQTRSDDHGLFTVQDSSFWDNCRILFVLSNSINSLKFNLIIPASVCLFYLSIFHCYRSSFFSPCFGYLRGSSSPRLDKIPQPWIVRDSWSEDKHQGTKSFLFQI